MFLGKSHGGEKFLLPWLRDRQEEECGGFYSRFKVYWLPPLVSGLYVTVVVHPYVWIPYLHFPPFFPPQNCYCCCCASPPLLSIYLRLFSQIIKTAVISFFFSFFVNTCITISCCSTFLSVEQSFAVLLIELCCLSVPSSSFTEVMHVASW